ncbi:hypothetical protein BXZ70DRAFT_1005856 [Cristinia sonorae]|uniref:Uncharacterized protein n=1 Tax=Cristinia sonorae TaxID=1940300 RepID=A0A8K0UVE8_9AGAR|nr:hypothetical protein BXZ70DRAFT_1005856 [Cristinia sonorae]
MGQTIAALRASIKEADAAAEEKAKQDLDILQKLVDAKLDGFEHQLNEMFLNPDSAAKTQVPGIRALRWERRSTCSVVEKPSEEVGGVVDDLFKIGDGNNKQAVKDGFKGIVKTALNVFLGNTEVGQFEESKFFVYMLHNTIIRVDLKLWRWNFSGKGFSDTHKSVLGYIMCVSAVSPIKLHTAEFVYLISEYAGDSEENVTTYIKTMQKMYSVARAIKKGKTPNKIDDDDDEQAE